MQGGSMGGARPHPPRTSLVQAWRWLGFVTAVWVQAISGNNYTFSNYSDALKSIMDLTQLELNNLSVAKDVGKAFGILAGLASDRLPTYVILLIGSLEGLVGYGAQWLVVGQAISPLPYWLMCVFLCMGGNSTTWMNTAVLVICLRNFRRNRGPVAGILKGFVGLSTAIFTDICDALFSGSASSFLIMLAVMPFAVNLTAMLCLREMPAQWDDSWESHYFAFFNGAAIVVALYLLAYDLSGSHSVIFSRVFVIVLLVLMATPLGVPLHQWLISRREKPREDLGGVEAVDSTPLLAGKTEAAVLEEGIEQTSRGAAAEEEECLDAAAAAATTAVEEEGKRRPAIGEDHTFVEFARTAEFWVLFVAFLCGVGTGIMVMNNMGQIGEALGYDDVSIFVSLLSISGFFGRLAAGSISEYFIRRAATPRPLWNAASQVLMVMSFVVMAIAPPGSLYVGSAGVGFAYGVRLAITVPTASEMFGLKHYGLIYNIIILNLPLGSFLFSGLVAGLLYDAQATETDSGGNTCSGAHCYRLTFVIMAAASVVGLALDVLLAFWTRSLYANIRASGQPKKKARGATGRSHSFAADSQHLDVGCRLLGSLCPRRSPADYSPFLLLLLHEILQGLAVAEALDLYNPSEELLKPIDDACREMADKGKSSATQETTQGKNTSFAEVVAQRFLSHGGKKSATRPLK
ncbi:hypothetical protein Taro_051367 [Colocasia esculenta]|uniref:Nodulin-like domain-containing protein n=1 Tax=Colocasia esculenta TaxID=4460 RepID=A0A843XGY2_COLES|nr:hypothetical protein [Colocasia esculenta]